MVNCLTGNHSLVEIYEVDKGQYSEVIRWCRNCGAIVIDVDFDNRTNAGQIMKMKFPKLIGGEL